MASAADIIQAYCVDIHWSKFPNRLAANAFIALEILMMVYFFKKINDDR